MELRHLRYFVAAAEEQHFARASEKLHVTRPAVSKIIADLESEIGLLLFERQGHRIAVTAAGKQLLPVVKNVLQTLTDAFKSAKRISEGKVGSLSVGYGTLTLHNTIFRACIKRFKEAHPDVSLTFVLIASQDQPKALAEGRIQAGFMHFANTPRVRPQKRGAILLPTQDASVVDWLHIDDGRLGVVMHRGHRLSRKRNLSMADLAGEPLIVVPRSAASPGSEMVHSLCEQAGFTPNVVQEVDSVAAMLDLATVEIGMGMGIMGRNFNYPRELRVIPVRDVDYTTTFVLGWLKGHSDRLVDALASTVRETLDHRAPLRKQPATLHIAGRPPA